MSRMFALVFALVLTSVSHAQVSAQVPAPTRAGAAEMANDEAVIRSLEEQERSGVLRQDFATLERIWSAHFMVNGPMNVVAPNRAVVLDIFRQGLAHYSSFDRKIEQLRLDGELAFVMGSETVNPAETAPRARQTVERRFTHVWKKEGGAWRLVARHANNILPSR